MYLIVCMDPLLSKLNHNIYVLIYFVDKNYGLFCFWFVSAEQKANCASCFVLDVF